MTGRLKILFKVIQRRVQAGESRDAIFADYNLPTGDEKAEIIATLDLAKVAEQKNNA